MGRKWAKRVAKPEKPVADAAIPSQPPPKIPLAFRPMPAGFIKIRESRGLRVLLSYDQTIVGIQFPNFPGHGPCDDVTQALFWEGFDYPDSRRRDVWTRTAADFLDARRGEHGEHRDPREAKRRQATCGDGKEANLLDAHALVRRIRPAGRYDGFSPEGPNR